MISSVAAVLPVSVHKCSAVSGETRDIETAVIGLQLTHSLLHLGGEDECLKISTA